MLYLVLYNNKKTEVCNMDTTKIGKFIAERRKALGMTQMQLAEKLSKTAVKPLSLAMEI